MIKYGETLPLGYYKFTALFGQDHNKLQLKKTRAKKTQCILQ